MNIFGRYVIVITIALVYFESWPFDYTLFGMKAMTRDPFRSRIVQFSGNIIIWLINRFEIEEFAFNRLEKHCYRCQMDIVRMDCVEMFQIQLISSLLVR